MRSDLQHRLQRLLRHARAQRDWSLEDLSRRTGLSRSLLSQIENGRLRLTVESAEKLAAALDDTEGLFVSWARALTSNDLGEVAESVRDLERLVGDDDPEPEPLGAPLPPLVMDRGAPRTLDERGMVAHMAEPADSGGWLPGFGARDEGGSVEVALLPEGERPHGLRGRRGDLLRLPRAFFEGEAAPAAPFAYVVGTRSAAGVGARLRVGDLAIFDVPAEDVTTADIDPQRDVFAVGLHSAVVLSRLRWEPPELTLLTPGSVEGVVIRPVQDADDFGTYVLGRLIAVLSHYPTR